MAEKSDSQLPSSDASSENASFKNLEPRNINSSTSSLEERTVNEVVPETVTPKTEEASHPASDDDVLIVDWDGPDDPANPKNWPESRKWAAALAVSSFTFISPVSSSMVAPASLQIAQELHITESIEISMTISVFVLAYAVGPLFLGPLSEVYGRSRVLQIANLFFLVWNLVCGFAQTKGQLIAFRFLAGLGGSAPLSVGGGVLSDMWNAEKRGRAVGIYSLAPLLGPVIGPIAGAWIAQRSTWRWVFRSTTIADAIVQLGGLYFLQETYAPVLLDRKAKKIRKNMDAEKGQPRIVRTKFQTEERKLKHLIARALVRPFVLFAQEPILQLFGIYLAFVYGTVYLVLTTLPLIYTELYHEEIGIVGLHYIALGLGLSAAAQINSRSLDYTYKRLKEKNNGIGKPEFRLLPIIPGACLLPIGLLVTGWSAQEHVFWIVPDIGFFLIGFGTSSTFQGLQAYVIDSFTRYAASALACVSCFRSLAGFGFPLFAPYMYNALGYGKGDTILAAFVLGIGIPALVCFYLFGEKIRGFSKRANHSHLNPPPANPQQQS
ncbi:hypothetical protein NM688_g3576 [Phlebia brevispora]|uniref:Uncharacterized protein n=1 Tax=Phlebia brevispora TaxID=194682 RepID=A0ACC1T5I1_9APHY|nr:hypothetical protein NM688_g3576 [Phlebia brevispora]